jgi:2-polyprenyl-6-methoxyphenol hydroxylase-like FAD-dependent oxidoreductase
MAGVTVARALADRFAEVKIFERDKAVTPRPHVPHLHHTHILGARGYRDLCTQFPGLAGDLEAAGAPEFDYGDCPFFAGKWMPRGPTGLISRSFTRPLLETILRRHLAKLPNVELVCGERVRDLLGDEHRVTGVRFTDGREVLADLVVDAAGIGSKTPEWLVEHGFPAPERTEIDLDGAAVSQLFRPAPERERSWGVMFIRRGGGNFRHGAISWVEDGLCRVSVWGVAGTKPGKQLPEFLDFARAMGTPLFSEFLEGATPVSPPYVYGNSWSQWIHYERLERFPDGLVVIGDATFHPNYEHGQGMTFCAMTADLVARHLDDHGLGAGAGSSLKFQHQLGEMTSPWWDWNLAVEVVVPDVTLPEIPRETQLRHHYFRLVREAAATDPGLWKAVLEVNQAVRHPSRLMQPSIVWRVLRQQPTPKSAGVDLREIPRKLGL